MDVNNLYHRAGDAGSRTFGVYQECCHQDVERNQNGNRSKMRLIRSTAFTSQHNFLNETRYKGFAGTAQLYATPSELKMRGLNKRTIDIGFSGNSDDD
jgi:hypothetical protein